MTEYLKDIVLGNPPLEVTKEIKERYPALTKQELFDISRRDLNKLIITHNERLVASYKELLRDYHKNHKSWIDKGADLSSCEEYRELLRWGKNTCESTLKRTVEEQRYL